jgi:hypothetical protein
MRFTKRLLRLFHTNIVNMLWLRSFNVALCRPTKS